MLTPIGRDYVKSTNDESESHELPVHLSTNQIAYYQVGLRGKTKTNLLRSESVAKLCLPVEGLELELR